MYKAWNYNGIIYYMADLVIITEGGCEVLNKYTKDLIIVHEYK
ncbi:hypothetical protein [Clostridium estertheticum]|nr:hypothetical protein [Clostridium estertheticum]